MAIRRVPLIRGLNLRDSVINRNPEYAQDLRNVEKNAEGEIILRWGYDEVLQDAGIIDLFEYIGAEDDPDRGALLALKSDGLYRLEGATLAQLPQGNVAGQPTWDAQTKPVEYNKVLYWNDPNFNNDLWKFDGYSTYRAGVPRPNLVNNSGTGDAYFWRVVYVYYDPQGNATYSDFQEFQTNTDNITLTVEPLSSAFFNGFYQKRASGTLQVINSGNLTVTIPAANHNYLEGDYVLLGDYSGGNKTPVKIDSIVGDDWTFNAADVGTDTFTIFQNGSVTDTFPYGVLEGRWEIQVYRSQNRFTNYQRVQPGTPNGGFLINTISTNTNINYGPTLLGSFLNEVYDDTLIRVLPPKGKYLAIYNDVMVISNLGKNQPDFGYSDLLGNDTRLEDSIVWSDIATLSNGSSIETFLVNNLRAVGNSEDGAISACHGNDDNLVVHKEKQSYYVNGDFVTNTLRIRRAMTEQNGAASHRSIRNVEGGHLYTTAKGVFIAVGGQKPAELSDIIQPLFTENALSLDTLKLREAKAVTDFLREKIYIFVPQETEGGIVLVYDYYYKEWFLHDNIPADKGFQDVGVSSTEIYFADSTALYRRNLSSIKDNDKFIKAFYWTGWFDIDFPSVIKKFANLVLMSITEKTFTPLIEAYCDWDKKTVIGTNTFTMTEEINTEDAQAFQGAAKSASYKVSNVNSDFHLTAYDLEYEMTQQKPKGDT